MSRESKRLKKLSSWLNSGNAPIQHLRENAIFAFPRFTSSAEAQVISCGIVKCLLTAYFLCNISAQKYQNQFTRVKVIASQRWDVFETQCIMQENGTHNGGDPYCIDIPSIIRKR